MKIKEIQVKSCLVKTNLPGGGFVINPYLGCQHACLYCYARFMKRFTKHLEPWGAFVDVKINAPEVLKKQLIKFKKLNNKKGQINVLLSSVTDPYQPLEKKYQVTKKILEIFLNYPQFRVEILTKSALVLRDLAILKKLNQPKVTFSLGLINDHLAKIFEPQASPPSKRIKALTEIHQAGIQTAAFISPILLFFTDLEKTFKALRGKVDEVFGETLNPKGANFINLHKVLEIKFPQRLKDYQKIYFTPYHREYLKKTEKEFRQTARKYHLPVWGFFTH